MRTATNSIFLFLAIILLNPFCSSAQIFTVQGINDPEFLKNPAPNPVHLVSQSFMVKGKIHEESLTVNSRNLRNLSITIENTGKGLIRSPHLFGPHGWDVRCDSAAFSSLARNITQGNLTKEQKFFRAFEWGMLSFHRIELHNSGDAKYYYSDYSHRDNSSRLFNEYGGSMCGEFHNIVMPILVNISDAGIIGCKYTMGGHTAGGVNWDGNWYAYNGSPTLQMAHYKMDGKTLASWPELKNNHAPIDSVNKYIGHRGYYGSCFDPDSLICPLKQQIYPPEFFNSKYLSNFKYSDLRPNEKMTMYFDMRGRYESKSVSHAFPDRNFVDYGSVVYTYRPNFRNASYEPYVIEQANIKRTKNGLEPKDPSSSSYVVFASNHYPWYHVGSDIKAWFKKGGNVYIGQNNAVPKRILLSDYAHLQKGNVYVADNRDLSSKLFGVDTVYSKITWTKLDPSKRDYANAGITGKSAFWIKFEFSGMGSGLDSLEISSELQMSPWAMPGLIYGKNSIRFEAKDMGNSSAKVTYNYDDQSSFYFYEPATTNTGKHIYHRLGGKLQGGSGLWARPNFWRRLKDSTDVTVDVTVRLYNVQNTSNIRCVRTLFANKPLKWGYYWWYWDGKDDQGNLLPPGMYAYRIDSKKGLIHTALTYLYPDVIWPLPNELKDSKK